MRKSIYDIRDERKKEINKYGSNEIQTTKAKEFLQNTKIKDIIKVPADINPAKVVNILRNTNGINWACISASYSDYSIVTVR